MNLTESLKHLHDVAVAIGDKDAKLIKQYIKLMPEHTGEPNCPLCRLLDFLESAIEVTEQVQPEMTSRAKIQ